MSIDTAIAELNTNILALVAALKVTGENQERLIAGQVAAIDKVEAPKATRSRTKKDETPAETTKVETPAVVGRTISEDDLKALAAGWLNEKDLPKEARTERGEFLKSVLTHLGSPKIAGAESTLDDDGRKQAWFFISRKIEGLKVDFSADYDFDGDVTAGGEPEAAAEDDLGI